jgi:hypothetical protein
MPSWTLPVFGRQHRETHTKREQDMAWIVSTVQSISLEQGLPDRPGFFIEQQGSSPTLTLVFEDKKTADECATAMKRIFDNAVGIRGQI